MGVPRDHQVKFSRIVCRDLLRSMGQQYGCNPLLQPRCGFAQMRLPCRWIGKSIRELNIRAKWKVNVIAVRRGEEMTVSPDGDYVFQRQDDCVVVLGRSGDLDRLERI